MHAGGGSLPDRNGAVRGSMVALIGLPGAGKTVVAPLLATRLGGRSVDLDAAIERAAGRRVPELLRDEGEAAFRAREFEALRAATAPAPATTAAAGSRGRLVVACGGGIVTHAASCDALRDGATVVWLRVSPEGAMERLGASGVAWRPLLGEPGVSGAMERLRALLAEREPLYRELAAVSVDTSGRTPEDVAAAVERALRTRWDASES